MPFFSSLREKRLWLCTLLVIVGIYSSLFLGKPMLDTFGDQNMQAAIFMLGMLLTAATVIVHGFRIKPGSMELTIWMGMVAVYLMFFLRLGLPERSHLMEYGVLAVFSHLALMERARRGNAILIPALVAFAFTFIIGILDECIQIFLPERVFDPTDILFNGLAASIAIATIVLLRWVRKRFGKVN